MVVRTRLRPAVRVARRSSGPVLRSTRLSVHRTSCPSSTANRLFIHRNTLSYRLDKIASLTGLDPRRFDDAVQIRLAVVLRSLRNNAS